jgi:vitamin B12 transporter
MIVSRTLGATLLAASGVLALRAPAAAQGERDTVETVLVPPIVVSVSRVETEASRVASSITVVSRADIEGRQLGTVLEALQSVPGVSLVRTGGPGSSTSVFLRGASSEHALVLVDGIEMNDPSAPTGGYDLATLGTDGVERIEVLRGPQSTIHGSSAMGGVVNVITRRGEGPPRFEVRAEGGAHGTANGSLAVLGASEGWSWAATASRRTTDGISAAPEERGNEESDGSRTTAVELRVERDAGPFRLALVGHVDDTDTDLDAAGPTGDDPNRRLTDREAAWKAEARSGGAEDRWRSAVSVSYAAHDRASLDDADSARPDSERGAFEGSAWKLAWVNDVDVSRAVRLVAGAETERERAATSFRSDGPFGPFESELSERSIRTSGVFGEVRAEPGGPAAIAIGVRLDDHDRFGTVATVRVAPAVSIDATGTRLRATWGTGFRAPTLFQLFDPQFGAPDLDAERSRGWDAGIDQTVAEGRGRIAATWFDTRFDDLITFTSEGYRNESETSTRGIEAAATALLAGGVRIDGAYTWTDAQAETGPDRGLPLIRRPRHQGSIDAVWSPARGPQVALGARWVGERQDLDFATFPAERVALEAYSVWRLALAWEARDSIRLFGRIENLFDAEYEEVLDFGTIGRAAYVGATFRP